MQTIVASIYIQPIKVCPVWLGTTARHLLCTNMYIYSSRSWWGYKSGIMTRTVC